MKDHTVACILNHCLNGKTGVITSDINDNINCKVSNNAVIIDLAVPEKDRNETRLYRRRWLMLFMHFFYTLLVSLQFAQFVIISNAMVGYYRIPSYYVDYTTVCFMIMYLPLVFPALWLFDKIGIRNFLLLSTVGICIGTWIKVYGSLERDRYTYIMIGQCLVAAFQVLSFGLAPRISTVWFGPDEVYTACAIAFFGDQLGSVFSFGLPGIFVQNSDKIEVIGPGITMMNLTVAVVTTILCISVALFFQEAPPLPPSSARMLQKLQVPAVKLELKKMLMNWKNVQMMIAYGMSLAVFNAFIILLNEVFLRHYPDKGGHVGTISTSLMLVGITGSLFGGYFLDKTHLFKETAVFYYGLSCVSMALYSFVLKSGQIVLVYLSTALFGFFIIGYYSVGVQICIEATYPISECVSSSVLLFCAHSFGILFTFLYRAVCHRFGDLTGNLTLTAALLAGTVLTASIPIKQSRQTAEKTGKNMISSISNADKSTTLPTTNHSVNAT